jgi:hypothetical protein
MSAAAEVRRRPTRRCWTRAMHNFFFEYIGRDCGVRCQSSWSLWFRQDLGISTTDSNPANLRNFHRYWYPNLFVVSIKNEQQWAELHFSQSAMGHLLCQSPTWTKRLLFHWNFVVTSVAGHACDPPAGKLIANCPLVTAISATGKFPPLSS